MAVVTRTSDDEVAGKGEAGTAALHDEHTPGEARVVQCTGTVAIHEHGRGTRAELAHVADNQGAGVNIDLTSKAVAVVGKGELATTRNGEVTRARDEAAKAGASGGITDVADQIPPADDEGAAVAQQQVAARGTAAGEGANNDIETIHIQDCTGDIGEGDS